MAIAVDMRVDWYLVPCEHYLRREGEREGGRGERMKGRGGEGERGREGEREE